MFRAPYSIAILLLICMAMMAACTTDTYYADDYRNCDREFGLKEADSGAVEKVAVDTLRSIEGGFNLASFLEPVKLEIGSLDKDLEKQESVTARIERNRISFTYKVKEMFFTEPYVEFDLTCRFRDSKDTTEMQFRSIAKLSDKSARNINLYRLLESEYLKNLIQKEGESFDLAQKHTHQAIHDLLDPETEFKYGIGNAPYGYDTLETFAYLYSLFFMKDTTFYKNFKKLSKAVGGEKKWDEVLSRKKILDKLIEHYRLGQSQCDTTVRNELKKDIDWTLLRYDMARHIVGDTMTCTADTVAPRDTVDVPDTTAKDSLHEVTAAEKFGECTINREQQKVMLDTGKYYMCKGKEWVPIMSPAYYEDYGEEGDIMIRDGEYFRCDGGFMWIRIPDEFVVPPVKDLQRCVLGNIAQYGDKVYRCHGYYRDGEYVGTFWYELAADTIPAVQRNGLFCVDSTSGRIEEVNGRYWTCVHDGARYAWREMTFTKSIVYAFSREHKDECKNGPVGTTIYWNEAISNYYSSNAYSACSDEAPEWDYMELDERNNYGIGILDGGVFVDSSTIVARHGDFTYTVKRMRPWYKLFGVVNVEADIGGKEYGAIFRNKVPYLSGKKGTDSIAVESFPGKSASFDSFVAQYMHSDGVLPAFGVRFTRVGEDSFMDFEKAAGFCPDGFHLPDTTEWTEDLLKSFPVEERYSQDSPLKVRYDGTTYLYDIYWTSASKDSETHYCYEVRYEGNTGPLGRTVECPNDLYPGVQTLCFKDGEEE